MGLPFVRCETWMRSLKREVDLRRISTPIKVLEEKPLSLQFEGRGGPLAATEFDFTFQYRDTKGESREGLGRIFVPCKRPREHLPTIVFMHYEIDAGGTARFLARGWAVITPTGHRSYNPVNLLGSGINHSITMAQLPRRMPFVDQRRIVLYGGSAGGYHALMASSFIFPVKAVVASVPPLNLKYNTNYLLLNDRCNADPVHPAKPIAPTVKAVTVFATASSQAGRPQTQNWNRFSPVYRTNLITFPTLITCFTGDVAVPVNQLSRTLPRVAPEGVWPEGFSFEMDRCVPDPAERLTLLDALRPEEYTVRVVKAPGDGPTGRLRWEDIPEDQKSRIPVHAVPWSRAKRFSIFVVDEGYPEPFCGHAKYHHRIDDISFFEYHLCNASLSRGMLTKDKLVQLMERFAGIERDTGTQYDGEASWPISRRDEGHLERWYVTSGLEAYIDGGRANLAHLRRLYRALPDDLKVLDLDRSASGRFDHRPAEALLYHQMKTLMENGDADLSRHVMRRILAIST